MKLDQLTVERKPPFHSFQSTTLKTARMCGVCKLPVEHEGITCRNCKFACHTDCQFKVVAACEPTSSSDQLKSPSLLKSSEKIRRSRSLDRYPSFAMDITCVTERIIVAIFPRTEPSSVYKSNLKELTRMLRTKHGTNYMVFNLSEKRQDLAKLNPQLLEFGWPQDLAPPLERLCSICKAVDSWLSSNIRNIVVLHSKNDRGRAGIVIAAYMHYSSICASAEHALDRFAMKQFYDDKLSPYMHPSQKRYVHYFAGLLSGTIRMNNNPLYLHNVIIHGVPNFDANGGCKLFIKVYQGMQHVYSSGIYSATEKSRRVIISLDFPLQIRGDIFVKCYHKSHRPLGRYPIFRIQFHTSTIDSDHLSFEKSDLDDAITDTRFPETGKVEFWFSYNKVDFKGNGYIEDSTLPIESSSDSLVKCDSYENFDNDLGSSSDLEIIDAGLGHEGPLDSSLYATVRKERKFTDVLIHPVTNHENFDGPHSIDSGISSSSGARNAETDSRKAEGTVTKTSAHNLKSEQAELDQLVHGMLQEIQSIPDAPYYSTLRPYSSSHYSASPYTRTFSSITTTTTTTQDSDYAMPRSRSRPTGIVSVNGNMQFFTPDEKKHTSVSKLDDLYEDDIFNMQKASSYTSPAGERHRLYSDGHYPLENLKHRHVSYNDSVKFHDDSSHSWLLRQQEKLKARREGRSWEDRQVKEQQLLAELRSAQHKKIVPNGGESTDDVSLGFDFSSSSRETSPSKCSSYTLPLHVNTYNGHASAPPMGSLKPPIHRNTSAPSSPLLPHRTSSKDITKNRYPQFQTQSKTIVRQKSDTSYDRERPFVSTKKAHLLAREQISNNQTSPQQVIAYSNVYRTHQSPLTSTPEKTDSYDHRILGLLNSPGSKHDEPAHTKLDKLEQSLQALSGTSPTHSPDAQHSPYLYSQSTPKKHTHVDGPSWSPSVISSSPPSSPSRSDRPVTPSFPVPPGTPYQNQDSSGSALPPKSPNLSRKDRSPSPATVQKLQQDLPGSARAQSSNGQSSPTVYYGQSRPSSLVSLNEPTEVIHHHPMFVKDTSKFWYKPNISREEAISILKDKPPGTFVVRDSNSFPGAYGLALKVATPPPNVQNKTGDMSSELVRHFLIEPTSKGVRLKGCPNEPIFGSLSALVYQHSITSLALPCKLLLPEQDPAGELLDDQTWKNDALLEQGAACSVLYLSSLDMESLTGPQAVRKALSELLATKPLPSASPVHFKVSSQGITLTDNSRKLFFRRHYPVKAISHCGLDPDDRKWTQVNEDGVPTSTSRCFGFVARKPASQTDNQCHLFAEHDPEQPASAIVNFVTKVMMMGSQGNQSNKV